MNLREAKEILKKKGYTLSIDLTNAEVAAAAVVDAVVVLVDA